MANYRKDGQTIREPSAIEEEGRRIAQQLGIDIRYIGPQYGKDDEFMFHVFNDIAVTGTSFVANTLEEAIASLTEKRTLFGGKR